MTEIHFAPIQGYADHIYRRLHAEIYGGVDAYYTPFIRVEKGAPRHQDIKRLEASNDVKDSLIPQIIFNSVDELEILREAVKELGYDRIDLNLGCPYPMQTGKGRGAELIRQVEATASICRLISEDKETKYSIKMRLGMIDAYEWRDIMPMLNDVELVHITLHPRTAKQTYSGELNLEAFDAFMSESANPVIWNGEIHTIRDVDQTISRYPKLKGVMIGRGLLARPSLAAEWREGKEWSEGLRRQRLRLMADELLEGYQSTLCGDAQVLQKIKPQWEYLEGEIGHKAYKGIKKATNIARYKEAVSAALEV